MNSFALSVLLTGLAPTDLVSLPLSHSLIRGREIVFASSTSSNAFDLARPRAGRELSALHSYDRRTAAAPPASGRSAPMGAAAVAKPSEGVETASLASGAILRPPSLPLRGGAAR